jgi:hypothetical protein
MPTKSDNYTQISELLYLQFIVNHRLEGNNEDGVMNFSVSNKALSARVYLLTVGLRSP